MKIQYHNCEQTIIIDHTTQEEIIPFNMEEQHNLPPNKRTCSRKEINALQADEDTIP